MSGDAQLIVIGRNQPESRAVIQIVGTFRGVAAGIAACVVLSGCASGQVGGETTTTSPAATKTPANPWDLPIEQRPALFDPCAEIPVEAVEQGVGGPVEAVESYTNKEPGNLISCGWKNNEVNISLLSTWKTRKEYIEDSSFEVVEDLVLIDGRSGLRLKDKGDNSDSSCVQLFFTEGGAFWFRLALTTGLNEFNGRRFAKACDSLDEAIIQVIKYVPEGDYR